MVRGRDRWLIFGLALVYTLLNAWKPLQVDDAAYYYFAVQAAKDPGNPYGFHLLWYQHPEPANDILAPPVIPYWWSLAIQLFGESPVLWKLWLFPFSLLLVWSLHALLSRFARGVVWPLLLATLFSPWLLPALNLMLDVPALALALSAIALFFRACDRSSLGLAVLSGLVAGVGMQTKYTGGLAPAVCLLYGLFHRRLSLAVATGIAASIVFGGWELFLLLRFGYSHFFHHLSQAGSSHFPKYYLISPLLALSGGVLPWLGGIGWAVLGISRRWLLVLATAAFLGISLIALVPERFAHYAWDIGIARADYTIADVVYQILGWSFWTATGVLVWVIRPLRKTETPIGYRNRRTAWFMASWLVIEILGYFALSPFPATRRLLGIAVVVTLIAGRIGSWTCRDAGRRRVLKYAVLFSILAGFAVQALDIREAVAQRDLARRAAEYARSRGSQTVWYVGHWGFQFYAENAGMVPVDPGISVLHAGDRLIVPERRIDQQRLGLPEDKAVFEVALFEGDVIPLRSVPSFYGGHLPFEHQEGPRLTVNIYSIAEDFVPSHPPRP